MGTAQRGDKELAAAQNDCQPKARAGEPAKDSQCGLQLCRARGPAQSPGSPGQLSGQYSVLAVMLPRVDHIRGWKIRQKAEETKGKTQWVLWPLSAYS